MNPAYYSDYINPNVPVKIIFGQTYRLLQHAQAALVTSGTATLETALSVFLKWCVTILR